MLNVAIFGFMAVGKSTVGRLLSEKLAYAFVDLDLEIVRKEGMEINEIFLIHGEAGFRELERQAVCHIALQDCHVIACGGGTVLDSENLEVLRRSSKMVLLTASPEEILRRIGSNLSRPLLNVEDRLSMICNLLKTRLSKYQEAAEVTVDTDGMTPEEVAELVLQQIGGVEA